MRQITKDSIDAFLKKQDFSKGNTVVKTEDGITRLLLHGNCIAKIEDNILSITSAGWQTNTTKERLNGIPLVHIFQSNYIWFLNGEKWSGERKEIAIIEKEAMFSIENEEESYVF